MANDELTSDPWDDFGEPTPAPEPEAVEAPPTPPVETPDVPSMPPPPPAPTTESSPDLPAKNVDGDPSDPELPGDGTPDADLAEAAPAMPDLEIPDIEVPQINVPNLDVPPTDETGGLEIPDLDLAGVGISAPDVEIPEVDTPIPDTADVDISDLDFSDLHDVDSPDMDIADGNVPDIEVPEASSTTRTPYSPMLAATGLFGESTPTEEPRIEIPETPTEDIDDLLAALDDDSSEDVEPIDLPAEPIDFDDAPEAENDIDFKLGANPPPSVYSELEDLSDLTVPDAVPGDEVDMAGSDLSAVTDEVENPDLGIGDLGIGDLSVAEPDSELPLSEQLEDLFDETEDDLEGAVHQEDFEGTDLDAMEEPPTEAPDTEPSADENMLDAEPAYGAAIGSEASEDLEGTYAEPEDAALAALAAMAAEIDPIVIGEEENTEVVDESLPVDTDDWLNEADDLPAEEEGFDIGIKLGTGEVADEAPLEADAEEEGGVDMGTAAAAIGGAAALGFGADALSALEPPELGEVNVPDMELPDMELPEVDVPDMELPDMDLPEVDVPDMDLPEVDVPDMDLPDMDLPEGDANDIEAPDLGTTDFNADDAGAFAAIDDSGTPRVVMFDDLETDHDVSAGSKVTGEPEAWGARWKESAQGWVEDESGGSTWRPIVTTSPLLSEWDVDTYLGVVIGDASLDVHSASAAGVAEARTAASGLMVDEALARGAHAVVGVSFTVQTIGGEVLVTASGTAVTLKADTPN